MLNQTKKYPEMNQEEIDQLKDELVNWFVTPEELRTPKTQIEIYTALEIPERTFYGWTAHEDFATLIIKRSLNLAKKMMPQVVKKLAENATGGKEKSIEMFLEYVADLSKKIDHTSKGEKINPQVSISGLDELAELLDKNHRDSQTKV